MTSDAGRGGGLDGRRGCTARGHWKRPINISGALGGKHVTWDRSEKVTLGWSSSLGHWTGDSQLNVQNDQKDRYLKAGILDSGTACRI